MLSMDASLDGYMPHTILDDWALHTILVSVSLTLTSDLISRLIVPGA